MLVALSHSPGQGPSDGRGHVRPAGGAVQLTLGSCSTLKPFAEPLRVWERGYGGFLSWTEQRALASGARARH